jgi:hypothetical protein
MRQNFFDWLYLLRFRQIDDQINQVKLLEKSEINNQCACIRVKSLLKMESGQIFKIIWRYVFNAEMLHKFKQNANPNILNLAMSVVYLLFCEFDIIVVN